MDSFTPLAEVELFEKIQKLEEDTPNSCMKCPSSTVPAGSLPKTSGAGRLPPSFKLGDRQYLNVLQSVGQSVHVMDRSGLIIYWNTSAEDLFGYSTEEALGEFPMKLLVDTRDYGLAYNIIHGVSQGDIWTGQFTVRKKSGERFTVIATNSPFYDDAGSIIGIVCTCTDSSCFYDMRVPMSAEKQAQQDLSFSSHGASVTTKLGIDPQQPFGKAVSSKLTNLVSLVVVMFI
ncbi:uncharacterized protein LOC126790398 [Argentina anserina]|uniref:uncharacterized protein LOC126790398 n=1 Tax=Argentina anserina TaxID=57926 RepID=UPI00217678F8|nr:uncharacterized protein LOC126790398 [Potentilla anserina]XP_050372571.1 uncharacterized protein LOC126790398 [Potentilla anserina]